MPDRSIPVQRNSREEAENDTMQRDQSRKFPSPQHQSYSVEGHHNVVQLQYNQKHPNMRQLARQEFQLEPDGHDQAQSAETNTKNLSDSPTLDYTGHEYSDQKYSPANYAEYVKEDYTFNNQNVYNAANFDDRKEFGRNHSAVIRVGDPSDVESADENYQQNTAKTENKRCVTTKQPKRKTAEEEQRKVVNAKYAHTNGQLYKNHTLAVPTRYDSSVTCNANVNHIQLSSYKNVNTLPINSSQKQIQKISRESTKESSEQKEYVNRNTVFTDEFTDEQQKGLIRIDAASAENTLRINKRSNNSEDITFTNTKSQAQRNIQLQNAPEVSKVLLLIKYQQKFLHLFILIYFGKQLNENKPAAIPFFLLCKIVFVGYTTIATV